MDHVQFAAAPSRINAQEGDGDEQRHKHTQRQDPPHAGHFLFLPVKLAHAIEAQHVVNV